MRLAPLVVAAVLGTTAAASTGCYGKYSAFHKVHAWNGKVTDSRVGNSAVHLVLWVVPVYPVVLLGDILIFNTVETFTGENPLE